MECLEVHTGRRSDRLAQNSSESNHTRPRQVDLVSPTEGVKDYQQDFNGQSQDMWGRVLPGVLRRLLLFQELSTQG
ncbi:hypothetical protein N7474_005925 [Penicillium riverlandense]|uniref:uncharacterized protein n=1 Tax=Penicillium riverlandense TaxID=1903569 RepID=UPI0025468D55|nr:uncharacterized protein N7474_005925 [Penicillium riverlandense]KAJ5820334.1 hypothetical protein N7474_005925 [Penicillium riverlandense]